MFRLIQTSLLNNSNMKKSVFNNLKTYKYLTYRNLIKIKFEAAYSVLFGELRNTTASGGGILPPLEQGLGCSNSGRNYDIQGPDQSGRWILGLLRGTRRGQNPEVTSGLLPRELPGKITGYSNPSVLPRQNYIKSSLFIIYQVKTWKLLPVF